MEAETSSRWLYCEQREQKKSDAQPYNHETAQVRENAIETAVAVENELTFALCL